MDHSIIWKSYLKAFLDPMVLKLWIVGILFLIFLAILKSLSNRAIAKIEPKKIKTKTLILIEVLLIFTIIIVWIFIR
jgi:hypothetical protein